MSLVFTEIPANQISPDVFIEIDTVSGAVSSSSINYKVLAIGQKTSAGTANPLEVVQATSLADAKTKAGAGSQIANMAEAYFSVDTSIPFYFVAAEDATAGAAAEGTITITGTATESGTYVVYVGGRRVTTGVISGDTPTDIGAKLAAAITADEDLPVTAAAAAGVITFTAKNKGILGNGIVLSENYYDDEVTPAGITTTVVTMAGGATNPDVQDIVDAIPETEWFQYIIGGYTASAEVTILETYLANRFVATQAKSGVYFSAVNSLTGISELTSYGSGRNSTHSQIMGLYNNISQPLEWGAALVTAIAPLLANRQSYNIADVTIPFVKASLGVNLFNNTEHNQLLSGGISTYNRTSDGLVQIDKIVTTYQTNQAGATDDHFREIQSFYNVQYLRFDLVTLLKSVYQNFNIVNDGVKQILPAKVTTPSGISTTIQNRLLTWEDAALIEDAATSITTVIVERSTTNQNRVNFRVEVNLANQLEVFAGQIGFQV